MESFTPNLTVIKESDKFCIHDDAGTNYGAYDTKEKAEENAALWREYYTAPLVF